MMARLSEIQHRIEEAYVTGGYDRHDDLKWSFLYTRAATYHRDQKFIFVGLNPGGGKKEGENPYCASLSCEEGNSYLHESWDPERGFGPGQAPLQRQIQSCFRELAAFYDPAVCYETMMDETMAANLVPFRSPNWEELHNPAMALDFSRRLWMDVLAHTHPNAMLTISWIVFNELEKILHKMQYIPASQPVRGKIGWGRETFSLHRYHNDKGHEIVLARLPHLSSRKIFSRDKCKEARHIVLKALAEALPPGLYKSL